MSVTRSHFTRYTSPAVSMTVAYGYLTIIVGILFGINFYQGNLFFRWGPPIMFFGAEITTPRGFYFLHVLIFFHQLVNNYVNTVVYPWIINVVQDPKNTYIDYPVWACVLLVNAFDIYSQVDTIFILMGFTSQISFVLNIIVANLITSTYINLKYLKQKKYVKYVNSLEQAPTETPPPETASSFPSRDPVVMSRITPHHALPLLSYQSIETGSLEEPGFVQ